MPDGRTDASAVPARLSLLAPFGQSPAHCGLDARAPAGCALVVPATAAVAARSHAAHRERHRGLAARRRWPSSAARSAASTPPSSPSATGCRAVLLNPAVQPARDLAGHIGEQTTWHDPDDHFYFRAGFVDELRALTPTAITQPRALLRRHRQGRRGARLARDVGALRRREHQAARRQRPRAAATSTSTCPTSCVSCELSSAASPRSAERQSPLMYALFEDAGKFHAGRVMSEADSSMQIELDSGKRVKVKAANVLLRFAAPAPAELIAAGQRARGRDRPRPRLGVRARRRVRLRRPGARLLRRHRPAPTQAGRGAVPPVRGAALLPPPRQGPVQQGAGRDRQGGAARHRAQEAARGAGRRLGARAGRRPLPGADARAALPDPVQARQERARVQGGGRGGAALAARAARPAEGGRRDRLALPVPLAALPVRAVPEGHRLRRRCRCRRSRRTLPLADGAAAFSIDDSATTEIDDALSVQGLGSGTVTFGIHIAAPALAFAPDSRARPGRARAPVDGLHAGLEAHDAARRRGRGATR